MSYVIDGMSVRAMMIPAENSSVAGLEMRRSTVMIERFPVSHSRSFFVKHLASEA